MKKILLSILVLLMGFTLVACKDKTEKPKNEEEPDTVLPEEPEVPDTPEEEEEVIKTINDYIEEFIYESDYSTITDGNSIVKVNMNIDYLTQEQEGMGVGLRNIDVLLTINTNLESYEYALVELKLEINIEGIALFFGGQSGGDAFNDVNLIQTLTYYQGNIYSSFEGQMLNGGIIKPLSDLIEFLQVLVIPSLPENIQGIVNDNITMIENYQEVREALEFEDYYNILKSIVSSPKELLQTLVGDNIVENSPLLLTMNTDNLFIHLREENEIPLLEHLSIQVNRVDNKFNFIKGSLKAELMEDVNAVVTFEVTTNNEEQLIFNEELLDYEVVLELRLEKLIKDIIELINTPELPEDLPVDPEIEVEDGNEEIA